jgi:hypothetical protein
MSLSVLRIFRIVLCRCEFLDNKGYVDIDSQCGGKDGGTEVLKIELLSRGDRDIESS